MDVIGHLQKEYREAKKGRYDPIIILELTESSQT